MIKYLVLLLSLTILFSNNSNAQKMNEQQIETKVKELLSKMSLEEKVGQMTQVTLQVVSKKQGTKDQTHELDLVKLEEAVVKYNVGSMLNVYDVAHSLEYWHEIINKMQDIALNKTPNKIPVLYGIDAIHGVTYTKGATLFPQSINMAATFNRALEEKSGEITSSETRASQIPWNFYPVLDMGRNPLWPRLWETFGEDVYLTTEMGLSYIKGAQGSEMDSDSKLAICLKHFVGYGFPLNGKDRSPAWIGERMMREYFLPPFKAAVEAGAMTVMVNSGENEGIPTHSDYHLLTEILKGEWNFKGFTVSDWEDIKRLHTRDRVADSPKEAVRMAVMAGIDMSMVPMDYSFYEYLLELVKEGKVPMSRIDDAVTRILRVKFMVGLFDNPYSKNKNSEIFASAEHTEANLQSARESIILVKNQDSVLPIKKTSKIFVTGPTANLLSVLNGGWTITWQGNEESLYPKEKMTVLEAIESRIGKSNVSYSEGVTFNKDLNTANAIEQAKNSDIIIACIGEPTYCETPGNINDLNLEKAQLNFVKELSKTGKPIVLVMIGGRPRIISEIENLASGILLAFLPGMEGGTAISEILFGDVNPSGKLPITYPRFVNDFVHYDYKPMEVFDANVFNPQWTFGYGLSYTKFDYSDLSLSSNSINKNENITVKVKVKNSGSLEGMESVLLYVTDLYGSVSRPVLQLKGFEKISLKPGEQKSIEFTITPEQLKFIGRDNKEILEAGKFVITVGGLKQEFDLK
jgi:beta-glucosidase